jgi:hypothetical protein
MDFSFFLGGRFRKPLVVKCTKTPWALKAKIQDLRRKKKRRMPHSRGGCGYLADARRFELWALGFRLRISFSLALALIAPRRLALGLAWSWLLAWLLALALGKPLYMTAVLSR